MNLLFEGLGCPDCGNTCGQQMNGLGALSVISFTSNPTSSWSCNDWVTWHQELVKAFEQGKFQSGIKYNHADALANAKKVFLVWWDKTISMWSWKTTCGYNTDFYNYFKSVGISENITFIASLTSPIANGIKNLSTSTGNVITSTGQTVESATNAAANTASTLKWLVPTIVVSLVVGLGYYGYTHYIKGNEKIKIPKPSLGGLPAKKKVKAKPRVIHI